MSGSSAASLRLPEAVSGLYSAGAMEALVDLRRTLHADPELSLQEERTAARLERDAWWNSVSTRSSGSQAPG